MRNKTIFLCGFMGCGKTTVGKELAKALGCSFSDLDELIALRDGRTIPEIFAQSGEEYFRTLESRLIAEKAEEGSGVVALGGGAVLKKENAEAAKRGGAVVFIDTPFEVCYGRICGDKNRPLAANAGKDELLQRYNSRLEAYNSAASFTVPGCGSPQQIVREIMAIAALKTYPR